MCLIIFWKVAHPGFERSPFVWTSRGETQRFVFFGSFRYGKQLFEIHDSQVTTSGQNMFPLSLSLVFAATAPGAGFRCKIEATFILNRRRRSLRVAVEWKLYKRGREWPGRNNHGRLKFDSIHLFETIPWHRPILSTLWSWTLICVALNQNSHKKRLQFNFGAAPKYKFCSKKNN